MNPITDFPFEAVAKAAHEAVNAYAEYLAESPIGHRRWDRLPEEAQAHLVRDVDFIVQHAANGTFVLPNMQHDQWVKDRTDDGWKLGPTQDEALKLHPNLVPWHELPRTQQIKNYLFTAVVGVFVEILLLSDEMAALHATVRESVLQSLRPEAAIEAEQLRDQAPSDDPQHVHVVERAETVVIGQDDRRETGSDLLAGLPLPTPEQAEWIIAMLTGKTEQVPNEVDVAGRQTAAGNDAPDHALPVPPVPAPPDGTPVEPVRGDESGHGE